MPAPALAETPQRSEVVPSQIDPDIYDAAVGVALDIALTLLADEGRPSTGRVAEILNRHPDLPIVLSNLAGKSEPVYDNTPPDPDGAVTAGALNWPNYARLLRTSDSTPNKDVPTNTTATQDNTSLVQMSATGEGAAAEPSSEAEAIKWGDWCYDVHLIDPAEAVLAAAEKGINDVNARELGYADAKDFTLHVKQLRRVVAAEVKRRIKFVEGSGAREARQETFANIKEKIESIPIGLLNVAKRLGNLVIDRALRPVETSKAAARAVARVPGRVEKWSDRTVDGFGKAWPSGVPPHL